MSSQYRSAAAIIGSCIRRETKWPGGRHLRSTRCAPPDNCGSKRTRTKDRPTSPVKARPKSNDGKKGRSLLTAIKHGTERKPTNACRGANRGRRRLSFNSPPAKDRKNVVVDQPMNALQKWTLSLAGTAIAVGISYQWLDRPIALFFHHNVARPPNVDTATYAPDPMVPLAVTVFIVLGLMNLSGRALSRLQNCALPCSLRLICAGITK